MGAAIILNRGVVIQKLIVMLIMQIVMCLQWLSLFRYLFYLQFKAFPKWSDISTSKNQKCAFSCTVAVFCTQLYVPEASQVKCLTRVIKCNPLLHHAKTYNSLSETPVGGLGNKYFSTNRVCVTFICANGSLTFRCRCIKFPEIVEGM